MPKSAACPPTTRADSSIGSSYSDAKSLTIEPVYAAGPITTIRAALREERLMARAHRDYDDIAGTYVFDGVHHRKGYHLNMMCMSHTKRRAGSHTHRASTGRLFLQRANRYTDILLLD